MGILKRKNGFTLIETLAVVAILAILMTMSIFVFITQMAKGRDARRKADLEKVRTVLEDYLNDEDCYPGPGVITTDSKICKGNFPPYLSQLPCDPLNSVNYNYFYSYDGDASCKSWYKIYTRLENVNDPIITKIGCAPPNGCGPSGNYNYWVSSPNMNRVDQIPTAEDWWLPVATLPPAPPTSTPGLMATSTPVPIPTATLAPTSTPALTSTPGPTATPVPTSTPGGFFNFYGCFSGLCQPIWGDCEHGICQCPGINYQFSNCGGQCVNPPNQCH